MAGKIWDDVMKGKKLTQEEIKSLYETAMETIRGARVSTTMAQEQIRILQNMCDHKNHKSGSGGCCPDCGADFSPD